MVLSLHSILRYLVEDRGSRWGAAGAVGRLSGEGVGWKCAGRPRASPGRDARPNGRAVTGQDAAGIRSGSGWDRRLDTGLDAHTQEWALFPAVLERVHPSESRIADRNFCMREWLRGLHERGGAGARAHSVHAVAGARAHFVHAVGGQGNAQHNRSTS